MAAYAIAVDGWRETEIGRSRRGVAIRVFLPAVAPTGLLVAGVHGEEPETLLLARRVLERVPGTEATMAVLPCANPDGVLDGVRQNALGVDLNRNYPASTWRPDHSFTYPPGTAVRRQPHRTNRSSPGAAPGSEPETRAVVALIESLAPALVVDLHAPLELLLVSADVPADLAAAVAGASGLRIETDLGSPTPGALRDWCADRRLAAITYEVEHAGLPALCARHLPVLEALVRGWRSSLRPPG
jgi:protein MpaA